MIRVVLLICACAVIALITLLPIAGGGQAVNLTPGAGWVPHESAANVALFVPAGFLLWGAIRGQRLPALALLALVVPSLIEVLQYYLTLGRISDVNDVLANAVGACLGFLLASARRPPSTVK